MIPFFKILYRNPYKTSRISIASLMKLKNCNFIHSNLTILKPNLFIYSTKKKSFIDYICGKMSQDTQSRCIKGGNIIYKVLMESQGIEVSYLNQNYQFMKETYNLSGKTTYFCFSSSILRHKQHIHFFLQKKKKIQNSLKNSLQNLLQETKKNPGKYLLGQRRQRQYYFQSDYDHIDAIIAKYNREEDLFQLTALSVASGRSNLYIKLEQSLANLRYLLLNVASYSINKQLLSYIIAPQDIGYAKPLHTFDKNKYRIHHIMICPERYCQPPRTIAQDILSVKFCSLQSIKFIACSNQKLLNDFKNYLNDLC